MDAREICVAAGAPGHLRYWPTGAAELEIGDISVRVAPQAGWLPGWLVQVWRYDRVSGYVDLSHRFCSTDDKAVAFIKHLAEEEAQRARA